MGQYGNEWVQFNQPYYKIPVGSDGLYRITYNDLRKAGLSASPDPKTFQLFHRGIEQPILVQGEADGIFNSTDYIEFFGRGNDGTLDSTLYANPRYQPHRYYNLYSDTTAYFLTVGSVNGKRIQSYSSPPGGLLPLTYHWAEKFLVLKENYSAGMDSGNIQQTAFEAGEGWMGVQVLHNQEISYGLEGITDGAAAGGKPVIEIMLTGRGPMGHHVDLFAGTRLLSAITFQGYESYKHTQEIEWSDIDSNGKLTLKIKVTGAGGPDRVSAGYIRLLFPQNTTLAGASEKYFLLPENPSDLSYIQLKNPLPGTRIFDVTNPSAVLQIQGAFTPSLDAVIPPSVVRRKIYCTAETHSPGAIRRMSFRQIIPGLQNYIVITHPSLRKPALGYLDPVKAYAEYRAQPVGGGFDTLVVNIDQLYDQFNYGEQSPRAIFQFMKFLASVREPDYLFLIGKGLDVNYAFRRNPSAFAMYKDLVPSAGYPASDMAFTAGLSGTAFVPGVATGRLTAINPAEVAAYFNKVKERDALPFDDLNRKKILHLSGGIEENEPAAFRRILQDYGSVAEGFYLGGNVQAIAKRSTDIKLVNIAEEVNKGLGLITFFGHSAPNTTDFDIGWVTNPVMGYNNPGKYPFLLMNGCDAGSFFLNTTILGENWIKTPNKGAVGFIAHSSYGLTSALQLYSSTFYDVAFGDSVFIKKGVGKVQQEVARRYLEDFGISPLSVSQVQQMVLLGDPAVKLFAAPKPDYAIDKDKISLTSFNGDPITAYTDSFRINIPVRNFGIALNKNIRIEVTRQFREGPAIRYDSIIPPVLNSDTISLVIRNQQHKNGYGINIFSIAIDPDNLVDELSETNNIADFEYFIPLNITQNLYPYNYSIVKNRDVNLSFQYTDFQSDLREFLVEMDTASTFDSGFKQQFLVVTRLLGKQAVELLARDTVVYYWRTKIAQPLENESKDWTVSSFTYINNGPEGWAQVDFPQFESNGAVGLVRDPALRRLHYEETISDIAIRTFSATAGKPLDSVSFKINGVEFNLLEQGGACRNNTINLVAFDRKSTQPYAGIYFKWYELLYNYGGRLLLCGREPYVINSFTPQELITGNGDDLGQYADNIQQGDSVVLFNLGNAGFTQWPVEAKLKLGSFGISSAQLDDLQDGEAVVIFGRKGSAPGSAKIFRAPLPQPSLQIERTIAGRFTSGTMSSVMIGPAQRWEKLIVKNTEVEPVDDFSFAILGIGSAGVVDTLKTNIRTNEDLSFINATQYPHLKVVFKTADEMNLTSVQLAQWLVIYEPVPEGLVFYRGPFAQQMVAEGQVLPGDFGFVNVSDKSFADSLTVRYNLLNDTTPGSEPSTVRINAPLPGDTTLFTIPFKTISKEGLNDVEVFVNPRIAQEMSYDNNLVRLPQHVRVLSDHLDPVMEVTFDGRQLENNEFVSANPAILIRLWDENRFIQKKDTLGVNLFLAFPCAAKNCEFQRINFSAKDLTWDPAAEDSDFKIHYSPRNLPEGTYTLRVEARDAKGNTSGESVYEITFRVQYTSSMLASPPYPNPFSLETIFDVLVTGETAAPYFYRLEITNLNGIRVSEFSDYVLGLHIGTNRIFWNGLGRDGQRLPDGIYLYRLFLSGSGKEQAYYGKIVLHR